MDTTLDPSHKRYTQRSLQNYALGQVVINSKKSSTGIYTHELFICVSNGNLLKLYSQVTFNPLPPAINYEYEEVKP